jgi:hypothetical protein
VQRNISATSFTYEKGRRMLPPVPTSPTPPSIPRRASAYPTNVVKVRPRYTQRIFIPDESDITRIPTLPQPTLWQYETPEYEAESSLSSLSLVVADVLTVPPVHQPARDIDQIDTLSGNVRSTVAAPLETPLPLNPLDTVLPDVRSAPPIVSMEKTPSRGGRPLTTLEEGALASWTTGRGAHSPLARRIASRQRVSRTHSASSSWSGIFSPLDRLRWWLLIPGRLEFLLWFGGTILLMSVTCIFLFVCLMSTGWLGGTGSSTLSSVQQTVTTRCTLAAKGSKPCAAPTHTSSSLSVPVLSAILNGPVEAGMPLGLRGQGFSANGSIALTHDAVFSCQPDTVNADGQGAFLVEIMVGADTSWGPGPHVITAYDTASKRFAMTTITLAPSPIGISATPTPVPPVPGITPTSTVSSGGGSGTQPTPVGQTPVTLSPTVGITSTPTQSVPAPTPTAGITPTPRPSPTTGITPTASATAGSRDIPSTSQIVMLNGAAASTNAPQSLGLWLLLMGLGYGLSLSLLGVAGMLYRRRKVR